MPRETDRKGGESMPHTDNECDIRLVDVWVHLFHLMNNVVANTRLR